MELKKGQGATEYLVLLAVVLIIALVSIALLSWFPGTAGDTRLTESQLYWKSASPLSVEDVYGETNSVLDNKRSVVVMIVKNNGAYQITLSKMFGKTQGGAVIEATTYWSPGGEVPLANITIAPGEAVCFGNLPLTPNLVPVFCSARAIYASTVAQANNYYMGAASVCNTDGSGTLVIKDFGFEYVEKIESNSLTKRFVGKDVVAKCLKAS
ncbi:MAG: hypothetical protein QW568_02515 [Candidatus Anstonellaceae archaeon]